MRRRKRALDQQQGAIGPLHERLGGEAEAFGRVLARALDAAPDRPKPVASAGARWRKVGDGAFPATARAGQRFCERLAADPSGWEIPGTAAVAGSVLVLQNVVGAHTVSANAIAAVSLSGRAVGVRETSGTGWLVVFDQRERAQDVCAWAGDQRPLGPDA